MQNEFIGKVYIGVYGLYVYEKKILLIKKARGPYLGLYDLPGGGIDFLETVDNALSRELKEETNADIFDKKFFGINEWICEYEQNGIKKKSHHLGIYYVVGLHIDELKFEADGQDSDGAILLPLDEIDDKNIAPIALPIIKRYLSTLK